MIDRYNCISGGSMLQSAEGDWLRYDDCIKVMRDHYDDLFHPEFGVEWQEPHGECYKAYWGGHKDALAKVVDKKMTSIPPSLGRAGCDRGQLNFDDFMSGNFKV